MTIAVLKPLEEPSRDRKEEPSLEDKNIDRLLSDNPFARQTASEWLKENGTPTTASRLEKIMEMENLSKEVRREIGIVLLALSHKHLDFANTLKGQVKRMMAIHKAFRKKLAFN